MNPCPWSSSLLGGILLVRTTVGFRVYAACGRSERSVLGTLLAVGILRVVSNGLVLLGISPFWQTAFIDAVIIAAVAIDRWLPGRSRV